MFYWLKTESGENVIINIEEIEKITLDPIHIYTKSGNLYELTQEDLNTFVTYLNSNDLILNSHVINVNLLG